MKFSRIRLLLLLVILSALNVLAGCQPETVGGKPSEEINPRMSQAQRDTILAHKKRGEQ